VIRAYKETDLEELLDVWYQSSLIAHPFLTLEFMEKEKKNIRDVYMPSVRTWVFTSQDRLVRFISMIGNVVGAIFVMPEKQGQGIGSFLMDFVSQFHEELEVEVFKDNKIGRQFYHKYGFRFINEYIHKASGHTLIRMKFTR